MHRPLRVAVESRRELTRLGLGHVIGEHPGRARVVVPYEPGALGAPDVIVYDLSGRTRNDETELRRLIGSSVRVVVLHESPRPELVERLLGMGAADVLGLDITAEQLLDSIDGVACAERGSERDSFELTEREIEVLALVASGLSNQEIAQALYVSINTVKTRIRTAYKRIGADTRSQAVIWSLRHGVRSAAEKAQPSTEAASTEPCSASMASARVVSS